MKRHPALLLKKTAAVDKFLLFSVISIVVLGLVMVASASIDISEQQFGHPFHFLIRQMIFLLIAVLLSQVIVRVSMLKIAEYSPSIFMLSMVFLVLVLIPHLGRSINGSSRWLGIGALSLQVSEFAKLATILYLSGYLVRQNQQMQRQVSGFLRPLCVLSIVGLLLLKEPDFGAAVVIMTTALAMMLLAGIRVRYFLLLLLGVMGLFSALAIFSPYRIMRITSFLNPWHDPYGAGYQLTQALIACGNGGFWGVGLGASIQKLFYLPEAQTDFLFAILTEELGLIGVIFVFMLYAILVLRGLGIARRAHAVGEYYSSFVAIGISVWLGLQFIINIGVNSGVLPTKGLTLPLMSYGGSSLLIDICAIAVLFRIHYETYIKIITRAVE